LFTLEECGHGPQGCAGRAAGGGVDDREPDDEPEDDVEVPDDLVPEDDEEVPDEDVPDEELPDDLVPDVEDDPDEVPDDCGAGGRPEEPDELGGETLGPEWPAGGVTPDGGGGRPEPLPGPTYRCPEPSGGVGRKPPGWVIGGGTPGGGGVLVGRVVAGGVVVTGGVVVGGVVVGGVVVTGGVDRGGWVVELVGRRVSARVDVELDVDVVRDEEVLVR
jgi:hypothetical protein